MSYGANELTAWDRDHFFHPSTPMGAHARGDTPNRIIVSGDGVYITDASGNRSFRLHSEELYSSLRASLAMARNRRRHCGRAKKTRLTITPYVGHGTEPSN